MNPISFKMCEEGKSLCIMVLCGIPGAGKSTLSKIIQQTLSDKHIGTTDKTDISTQRGDSEHSVNKGIPSSNDETTCDSHHFVNKGITMRDDETTCDLDHSVNKGIPSRNDATTCDSDYSVNKGISSRNNEETFDSPKFNVFYVAYDELISEQDELEIISASLLCEQEETQWKVFRQSIIHCVEHLIHMIQDTSSACQCLNSLDKRLWDKMFSLCGLDITCDCNRTVMLIDDNMYYRSMRYKFYQLCRKYELGFCQIYVTCDEDTAKLRNEKRTVRKVPDDVINNMRKCFEKPDPTAFHWERYSLQVNGTHLSSIQDIIQLVISASNDPAQPIIEEDTEEKEVNRLICSTNQIHQADQIMRKIISQEMTEAKEKHLQKFDMQKRAKTLGLLRSEMLDKLRCGDITCDINSVDSAFHMFISDLFHSRIMNQQDQK